MWDCCMLLLVSVGCVLDFKEAVDCSCYLLSFLGVVFEFSEIQHTQEMPIKLTIYISCPS